MALGDIVEDVLVSGQAEARGQGRSMLFGRTVELSDAMGRAMEQRALAQTADLAWAMVEPDGSGRWGFGEVASWTWEESDALEKMAQSWADLRQNENLPPHFRLGGGFAFRRERTPRRWWSDFPGLAFTLPAVTLVRDHQHYRLDIAVRLNPARDLEQTSVWYRQWARAMERDIRPSVPPNPLLDATLWPSPSRWMVQVQKAVAEIRADRVQKVVLARGVRLAFLRPMVVGPIWARVIGQNPGTYRYLIPRGTSAFLGATPEVLVTVQGDQVDTMCLAGTLPADNRPQALLNSRKDRAEHEWVRRHVADVMKAVCAEVRMAQTPEVMPGRFVQHLYTPVTGTLGSGFSIWDVVSMLYPTPAVGGTPTGAALAFLDHIESIDRGWYAGAVGTVDLAGQGQFVVALRCALLRGNQAVLFGGSGLVAESDPACELEESSWKMMPMLNALGEEEQPHDDY